jgi:FkbM family methyltransferase
MKQLIRLVLSIWRHPLNINRLSAISRMLRWQIATRILPESIHALPFVNGSLLMAKRGDVGVTGNWYNGLDEPFEMGFLLHVLRRGDLFVDVGANVGSFTILACSINGVTAIAYEPIPETAFKLRRNILVNNFEKSAKIRMVGVSDVNGTLRFTLNQDSMNHVVSRDEAGVFSAIEIKVVTLDDELADLPPEQLVVLKIDVEGHEHSVIAGARNVLSKDTTTAVIMETNGSGLRYGVSDEALFCEMLSLGFKPCIYDIETRELSAISHPLPSHTNTIFVKNVDDIRQKIKMAPPLVIQSMSA